MPETVIAPSTGRGVVQLDFSLDGSAILDPPQFLYLNGETVWGYDTWQTGRHVLQAGSREVFDEIIVPKLLSKDRQVRVRVGVVGSDSNWGEWSVFRISKAYADASDSGNGYPFVLELQDALSLLDLPNRTVAWRGRLSDIVRRIVTDFGFKSTAIEQTQADYALIQSYESDYDFLRRISHLAVNETGFGNYNFYVVGETFHFHTRGWQSPGVKVFLGNTNPAAAVWTLSISDALTDALNTGAAGINSVVYDPMKPEVKVVNTRESGVKRLANATYSVDPLWYTPNPRHGGQNQVQTELDRAQSMYDRTRADVFSVKVGTFNVPGLAVGDVVRLDMPNQSDSMAGLYTCTGLVNSHDGGSFKVVMVLSRGELNQPQQPVSMIQDPTDVTSLAAPHTAPGKMLDVAAVWASTITNISGGNAAFTVPVHSSDDPPQM